MTRLARLRRLLLRLVLLVVLPAVAVVVGLSIYLSGGRYVSTDNAYVKAAKVAVSAEVSGHVVALPVQEHQHVAVGDLLFRLDEAPYRLAVQRAEADLAAARQELEEQRMTYRARAAELRRAEANRDYLRSEYDRLQGLYDKNVLSRAKLDAARHDLRSAELEVEALREDLNRVRVALGGAIEGPLNHHPRLRQAAARRAEAALDHERTHVTAPVAGVVGPLALEPGEYVQAGKPVLSLLGEQRWVEANLKETDLTHVQPGQVATVSVDAYPDRMWHATVASISPATGSEFSLLPPQNASGNWVKVVQRLPVRLQLDAQADAPVLRGGMSAHVTIDTEHVRNVPPALRGAAAWGRTLREHVVGP